MALQMGLSASECVNTEIKNNIINYIIFRTINELSK